jgi:hypothetical protein
VAAIRARSASSSATGVSILNGRIAVAPADFSVTVDMWVSFVWFGLAFDVALRQAESELKKLIASFL